MSNKKVWNDLTSRVEDLLSEHLSKDKLETALESWKGQKSQITKLVNASTSKKKKDPNAPKKPLTSYILFSNEVRKDVEKKLNRKGKDFKTTDITRKIGEMWRGLSENDKKPYKDKAEKDKKRYKKEMESYTPSEEYAQPSKKKERTGPKRPKTSFFLFCDDERANVVADSPDLKPKQVSSELGKRWKALSDEEKAPYVEAAAKAKEKYNKEVGKTTEAVEPKKTKSKKKVEEKPAKKTKKKEQNKNSKITGNILFCQENRDEVKDEHPSWKAPKVTRELNKRWKNLSEDEKEEYEERAAELKGVVATK